MNNLAYQENFFAWIFAIILDKFNLSVFILFVLMLASSDREVLFCVGYSSSLGRLCVWWVGGTPPPNRHPSQTACPG